MELSQTMDNDLLSMSPEQLLAEVEKLREVIRYHRDCKGHDRCWLDDLKLYQTLPEGAAGYDGSLPPKKEFLANCREYYKSRRTNAEVEEKIEPLQFSSPDNNFCLEFDEEEGAAEEEARLIDMDMAEAAGALHTPLVEPDAWMEDDHLRDYEDFGGASDDY
jgi:hypothetical protein